MAAEGVECGEDYRGAARQVLVEFLEGRMGQLIDQHLERMAELQMAEAVAQVVDETLGTQVSVKDLSARYGASTAIRPNHFELGSRRAKSGS
jgi:hypothetical protein